MNAVVKVTKILPHFRHHSDEPCDPKGYLHTAAVEVIQQAHFDAKERGVSYMFFLPIPCMEHRLEARPVGIDLADGWGCEVEKGFLGKRPDLRFAHADGRRIIVEVVVTHDIEPETKAAYENAGVPVAIIRPTLETLSDLSSKLISKESQNFESMCSLCKARAAEILEAREAREKLDRQPSRRARTQPRRPRRRRRTGGRAASRRTSRTQSRRPPGGMRWWPGRNW